MSVFPVMFRFPSLYMWRGKKMDCVVVHKFLCRWRSDIFYLVSGDLIGDVFDFINRDVVGVDEALRCSQFLRVLRD